MSKALMKKGKFTIKKKLIVYCYLIVTPILLIISAALFYRNYKNYLKERKSDAQKSVQSLSDSVEVMQMNMIEFANYISVNREITNLLTSKEVERLNKDALLWTNEAPMQFVEDMLSLKGYIKTIAIYPENGVKPYLRCMDASSYISNVRFVRDRTMYKEAVAAKGKVIFRNISKTDRTIYETNRSEKLVLCREIYDLSKKNKLAYLIVGANIDKFQNLAESALQNPDEGIVILSREGNELMRAGEVDIELTKFLAKEFPKQGGSKNQVLTLRVGLRDIFYMQSSETGTYVIKSLPYYSIKRVLVEIAATPLILMLGVFVGLLPVLLIVSNIITKPIEKLMEAMEKFKKGDFSQQIEITANDEIGEAAQCFNHMVKDMEALIEQNYVMTIKERESELTALQAQINPHFLYNTLDSLYWKAETAGNEEIAENILDLSQLFRMVLGQGKSETSVRNEMELIQRYLSIQKMRFSRRLDYEMDVQKEVLDCIIPKLILQPFVENSIVHGFEGDGSNYKLKIIVYSQDDYLVFLIKDTGVGMTKEQLDNILTFNEESGKSMRIGRYAIRNVYERLQIKYKNDFVLTIDSEYKKGTNVTIKVPMKR